MSASPHVEDVMLADVERIADSTSRDLERVPLWKNDTTSDLLYLMRQPYLELGVTVDDLACALDAIDSLRRAREWELEDSIVNGTHWVGAPSRCGCASARAATAPLNDEAGPATP